MICIYKIISPKGKVYIGQSIDFEKRKKQYYNLHCKRQIKLYNSFLKYGVENHFFEIIEHCDIDLLNERERYYQELYDCVENGLNCKYTKTKDKSGKHSLETCKKISARKIEENSKKPKKERKIYNKQKKFVLDLQTGVYYNSIKDYCNYSIFKTNLTKKNVARFYYK